MSTITEAIGQYRGRDVREASGPARTVWNAAVTRAPRSKPMRTASLSRSVVERQMSYLHAVRGSGQHAQLIAAR